MIYYLEASDLDMNNKILLPGLLPENKDKIFVVMVKAEWCGHCKTATPKFEEAAKNMENNPNAMYCIADVTTEPELSDKTKFFDDFRGFPHFSAFKNGVEIKGALDKAGGKRDVQTFMNMGMGK